MKVSFLDIGTNTLAEAGVATLLDGIQQPHGVVLVMSAFVHDLHTVRRLIQEALPQRTRPPILVCRRRYDPDTSSELALKISDLLTLGDESVVALVDQPWHTLHYSSAASAELGEIAENLRSAGNFFTCAYVTSASADEALRRYRHWLGACDDLHKMSDPERSAFFGTPAGDAARSSLESAAWKDRLETARAAYCDAILRIIAGAFRHLEQMDDRKSWRVLGLSLAEDFLHGTRSLQGIVASELQPRAPGWGTDTAPERTEPNGEKRVVGLCRLSRTTRALSMLAERDRLNLELRDAFSSLTSADTGFAVLAGWLWRPDRRHADIDRRVQSVERTLREARNRLVHPNGSSPTPLVISSLEQVIVCLEELAHLARTKMPSSGSQWELGSEKWMLPLSSLDAARASELAREAERRLRQRSGALSAGGQASPSWKTEPVGASALLSAITKLDERDAEPLQQSTRWMEWQHLITIRRDFATLVR